MRDVYSADELEFINYFGRRSSRETALHMHAKLQGLAKGLVLTACRYQQLALARNPQVAVALRDADQAMQNLVAAHRIARKMRREDIPQNILDPIAVPTTGTVLIPSPAFRAILRKDIDAIKRATAQKPITRISRPVAAVVSIAVAR